MTNSIAPDDAIGRVSCMEDINRKRVMVAAIREAEQRQRKLKLVLDKVNESDFGICCKCKKTIPEGQLRIRPETELCVHYAI